MKIYDVHNDAGQVIGFEIPSIVGRWRACRAARGIAGARVLRWPRRWSWSDDWFCEFDLDGVRFVIEEEYGDNSRFTISSVPPAPGPTLMRVRAAFADAPMVDWRFGRGR